jgi:hypothetical protein
MIKEFHKLKEEKEEQINKLKNQLKESSSENDSLLQKKEEEILNDFKGDLFSKIDKVRKMLPKASILSNELKELEKTIRLDQSQIKKEECNLREVFQSYTQLKNKVKEKKSDIKDDFKKARKLKKSMSKLLNEKEKAVADRKTQENYIQLNKKMDGLNKFQSINLETSEMISNAQKFIQKLYSSKEVEFEINGETKKYFFSKYSDTIEIHSYMLRELTLIFELEIPSSDSEEFTEFKNYLMERNSSAFCREYDEQSFFISKCTSSNRQRKMRAYTLRFGQSILTALIFALNSVIQNGREKIQLDDFKKFFTE